MKHVFTITLERPAKRSGADRYIDRYGDTYYIPQRISRLGPGEPPLDKLLVEIKPYGYVKEESDEETGD